MRPHANPFAVLSKPVSRLTAVVLAALVCACEVGPDYQKPEAPVPVAYKEQDGWKKGEPRLPASQEAWWSIYNDPVLDGLERQIAISNQNLKAAEASYREAQAVVAEARAGYYPTVTLDGSGTRSQAGSGGTTGGLGGSNRILNQFNLTADATWTIDVWGRIRRTVESDIATAQASAADLAAARLSAQAALATDYFQLRIADELKRLLDDTVKAYTDSLQITQNQYDAGVVAQTDVISAQTQLQGAQSQEIAVGVQRAQFEHAIAVLIGRAPGDFAIAPSPFHTKAPAVPAGIPSTLLERNPGIAAAERQMAAANAQIGVAISAYYPDLTLSASLGQSSTMIGNLLAASNRVWSFGPTLAETVFDAGLRGAQVEQARASYDQTVANYRQTVLSAFQQVEDNLAALRILAQQAEVQDAATHSALEAVRLTLNQYQAGTVAYTSVVTNQAIALADEQTVLTILQSRLLASVTLIEALGGGWQTGQLPEKL